jgi:putative membrane protein
VTPSVAVLHTAHDLTWRSWHLEPTIVAGALIVLGLYFYGLRVTAGAFDAWRVLLFLLGSLILFVALTSPLDVAAERLLSMHMLQHVALTSIGPPLVVLGLPPGLLDRVFRPARAASALRALANPFVAATLFIVNMWLWHVPYLYQAALDYDSVHALMHVAFMSTGLLFWWPAIQPLPRVLNLGTPARLFYIFVTGFPMAILALLLISSQSVLYPSYDAAERLWGISAISDQQIAGVIMGSLGEAASFIAFTLLFLKLVREEEESAPSHVLG